MILINYSHPLTATQRAQIEARNLEQKNEDNYMNRFGVRQMRWFMYGNFYAAQAFYQAGDEYWDDYFPVTRDHLLKQQGTDGSWDGDGIGPTYGTSLSLIILQLPYKFLPVYQR